jgi:hypothetical protein
VSYRSLTTYEWFPLFSTLTNQESRKQKGDQFAASGTKLLVSFCTH